MIDREKHFGGLPPKQGGFVESEKIVFEVGDIVRVWPWNWLAIVLEVFREDMIMVGYFDIKEHPINDEVLVSSFHWFEASDGKYRLIQPYVHYARPNQLKFVTKGGALKLGFVPRPKPVEDP